MPSLPRRLVLLAALPLLTLTFAGCDAISDPDATSPNTAAEIIGTITNTTGQPVAGARVSLGSLTATTGADGRYTIHNVALHQDHTFTVEAQGYTTYTETIPIDAARAIDRVLHGPNQVSGEVVNSQDGQGLPGATVTFSRSGQAELVVTTNSAGFFNIMDAPSGTFDLTITKEGFLDYRQAGVNITGGSFSLDPITLAERPPPGALRIVVSWGQNPTDLDAHLTGPDGSGGRFHVYYANGSAGGATLDHDDTSSYGPETVTITTPRDGMYRYSIHNYSDRNGDPGTAAANIAASPTRVQVYDDTGLIKSYTAPSGGSGNTWRVFEMTVSGVSRTFADGGGAGLGYLQASSPSDTGVFLTSGGDAPGGKHASH